LKLKGVDGNSYKQWSLEFKGDATLTSFQSKNCINIKNSEVESCPFGFNGAWI